MRRFLNRRRARAGGEGGPSGGTRAVYGLVGFLATVVDIVVGLICLLILAGILCVVLGANEDNAVVGAILDAAEFLVGPFSDIFQRDDRKEEVAINWGIALIVYFAVGRIITAVLRRGAA